MKTLGDGQEMTVEDAEIVLEDSTIYFDSEYLRGDEGVSCCIDGEVSKTQFIAMGVIMGWIDGETFKVTK